MSAKNNTITISNIKSQDITPVPSEKFKNLMPTVLRPMRFSFEISNCNNAMANGIRRVLCTEYQAMALNIASESVETNDRYILKDFITSRIRCIPILQNTDPKSVYTLECINSTSDVVTVKTNQIKLLKDGKIMPQRITDETILIIDLNPGCYIKLNKIFIDQDYCSNYGGYTISCGDFCVALDVEPRNLYENTGVSSAVSDPRHFKIQFDTNGTMAPKAFLLEGLKSLISRLDNIVSSLHLIQSIIPKSDQSSVLKNINGSSSATTFENNLHKLVIRNETHTIGNIIVKTVCDLYPNIQAITYTTNDNNKILTIDIRDNNPSGVLNSAIKKAVSDLRSLIGQLN
jgi:DNA-directed RNA polymerase subunit L